MKNPYSSMSSDRAEAAKGLLIHYLTAASQGRDLDDGDCYEEISNLIDAIVDAAVQKTLDAIAPKEEQPTVKYEVGQTIKCEISDIEAGNELVAELEIIRIKNDVVYLQGGSDDGLWWFKISEVPSYATYPSVYEVDM